MMHLSYQPAYDPFHTAFRMVRLARAAEERVLEVAQLRILDFYLVFPQFLESFPVPPKMKKAKKEALAAANEPRYDMIPEKIVLFSNMRTIQDAALHTLATKGLFRHEFFMENSISLDEESIPHDLILRIDEKNEAERKLIYFFSSCLLSIPLLGPKGLKYKSGLMEYRYDFV